VDRALKRPRTRADDSCVTRSPESSPERRSDAGMSLVEVMVALVLFAILGTAIVVSINTASKLTYEDGARLTATNLAVRELEIARDTFTSVTRGPDRVRTNRVTNPSPLPGGSAGQPLVVDGTAYTVVREAQWASTAAVASACDEGSSAELSMLRVDVTVSWPALGDRPPVEMSTLMTPPKGTYSALTGHIGVRVIDRNGEPVVGATVTAKSASGAVKSGDTASDGCVLLSFLDAGTWTMTLDRTDHVNPAGDQTAKTTANVVQGQIWRGTIEYDEAAGIDVRFRTMSGHDLPTGIDNIPVSLGNSAIVPSGMRAYVGTGQERKLRKLWPYPSGYQVWAGACVDNDPGDARENPVEARPGHTESATAKLAPIKVLVPNGSRVTALHVKDTACTTDVSVVLNPGSPSTLLTSLPYGKWTVSRTLGSTTKSAVITVVPPTPDPLEDTDPSYPPVITVDLR
jgi:prepilin-type N-terminal cleavage/methylation domain-containing protein